MALDPKKKKQPVVAIPYPQRVGATLRQADQATAAGSAAIGNHLGSRLQSMDNDVSNVQGAVRNAVQSASYGYTNPAAKTPAPAPVPAPVPKPSFGNARGAVSSSIPSPLVPRNQAQLDQASQQEVVARARTPVATVPAAGAPTPAGGGAGFSLKAGDPNTFTGADKITKPVPDMLNRGGVDSQSFGGSTALQIPAAVTPQPKLTVDIPRPAQAATYSSGVLDNQRARDKMISDISSRLFAIGNPNTRGKRGMVEGLVGAQAGLLESGGKLAADIAGGDRDAFAKYDLAGIDQTGQNQRALLADQGDTQRTLIGESGANARTQLTTAADLEKAYAQINKPEQITDADGNALNVADGIASPITTQDGKPVRVGGKDSNVATPDKVLEAYNEQVKALTESAALSGQPVDLSALDASPLGQRAAQVIGGQQQAASGDPLKDAQAAIATGRISKEDARQRLIKAGHTDLAGKL